MEAEKNICHISKTNIWGNATFDKMFNVGQIISFTSINGEKVNFQPDYDSIASVKVKICSKIRSEAF